MKKINFYYSSMDAGKTTMLLQAANNYLSRGLYPIIIKPAIDDRETSEPIMMSRIGLKSDCTLLPKEASIVETITPLIQERKADVIMIDEVQFLTLDQVKELNYITIELGISVICYGLRSDFCGNSFPASTWLWANSNELTEVPTMCGCGRQATHVVRVTLDPNSNRHLVVKDGPQVQVGNNDTYISCCRECHYNAHKPGNLYWD